MPGFVDAHDPEGGLVQSNGVAYRFLQVIGRLAAQDDLLVARQGLAVNDFEMLDSHLVRVIAADDEVRDLLHLDYVEDHARYVAHVGQLCYTLAR